MTKTTPEQTTDTATKGSATAGTGSTIRDGAAHAYDSARDSTLHAYDATRQGAKQAATRAADGIESNPLAVLAGGLALGAIAGALLPKSEQEARVLGPLGKRLSETATAAAIAAREAGKQQLTSVIPDKDAAKEGIRTAVSEVVQAAKDGGKSAASNTGSDTGTTASA